MGSAANIRETAAIVRALRAGTGAAGGSHRINGKVEKKTTDLPAWLCADCGNEPVGNGGSSAAKHGVSAACTMKAIALYCIFT